MAALFLICSCKVKYFKPSRKFISTLIFPVPVLVPLCLPPLPAPYRRLAYRHCAFLFSSLWRHYNLWTLRRIVNKFLSEADQKWRQMSNFAGQVWQSYTLLTRPNFCGFIGWKSRRLWATKLMLVQGIRDSAKRTTLMEFIHWIPWNNLNFPRQESIPCL